MGYTNFVLNDGIFKLNIVSDKLILAGLSNNLYFFDLENTKTLEELMNTCRRTPAILNFDGKIST